MSSSRYNAYIGKAMELRSEFSRQMMGTLRAATQNGEDCGRVDALLFPTATTGAPLVHELADRDAKDPIAVVLDDLLTVGPSLAGLPAVSVPAGVDEEGLPLGMQVVSGPLHEDLVLKIGQVIAEQAQKYM